MRARYARSLPLVVLFMALLVVGTVPVEARSLIDQVQRPLPSGDVSVSGYVPFASSSTDAKSTALDTLTGLLALSLANATSTSFSIAGAEAVAFGIETTDITSMGDHELRYSCSAGDSTAWTAWTQAYSGTTAGENTATTLSSVPKYSQMRLQMRQINGAATGRFSYRIRVYVLYGK